MLEDLYLKDIRDDPRLLGIYERAIKPFGAEPGLCNLTEVLSDEDFRHVVDFLGRHITKPASRELQFLDTPAFGFLYDLTRPLFRAVFFDSPLSRNKAFRETAPEVLRFHKRIWDGWMRAIVWQCTALKALADKGDQNGGHPPGEELSLRWFFVGRCIEAARESLAIETLRQKVLTADGVNPVKMTQAEEDHRTRFPQAPYFPYFHLGAETIFWLGHHLARRDYDKELANGIYFILDRQLRTMRTFDQRHGCLENGTYHKFRNWAATSLLARPTSAITGKLIRNLLVRFQRVGLDSSDIAQEVQLAAVTAVDRFDHRKTSRPLAYFNKVIETTAYTALRKVETRWKRVTFGEEEDFGPDSVVREMGTRLGGEPDQIAPPGPQGGDAPLGPLPSSIRKALGRWLTETEAEILFAKCSGREDRLIAQKLGISPSRVRGLAAQAKNKLRKLHPLPDILLMALGL